MLNRYVTKDGTVVHSADELTPEQVEEFLAESRKLQSQKSDAEIPDVSDGLYERMAYLPIWEKK